MEPASETKLSALMTCRVGGLCADKSQNAIPKMHEVLVWGEQDQAPVW